MEEIIFSLPFSEIFLLVALLVIALIFLFGEKIKELFSQKKNPPTQKTSKFSSH